MVQPFRSLASMNGRFAGPLARTLLAGARDLRQVDEFAYHARRAGLEFTETWADDNMTFSAPLLRDFAEGKERIDYLEIGAYEGRHLAFVDHLLPGRIAATVIDPWFNKAHNSEEKYHAVEPRFHRNVNRLRLASLTIVKGFSTYELPRMLASGAEFDLIYVDGSHTAWAVFVDLAFCASLLRVGGLMILDDYWHEAGQVGGPGVKQAADRFHGAFKRYFEIAALHRQLALRKTAEIPR
jgi:hypothetical protein